MLKYVQVFVSNKWCAGLNETKEVSFLRTLGRSNSVCLYRCAKEGKFVLCVPKMQIVLAPIKRKIKFNVVDTFIRVSVFFLFFCFGFLHHCHCKTTLLHLHPVLHPVTFCYIRSAVVLLGLQAYAFSLFNILSPIDYPNIWLDSSQRHYFGLFKGVNLLCTFITTRLLYFLVG